MEAKAEIVKSTARRDGWRTGMIPLALGIPSLIRGVDRIGDGHPLSGWLALGGGAVMVASAVWFWLARRRA
jgi:hypothetical protein